MRSLERVNIRTNVRTYSHTYVRDRPYIPSTTLLCEGIIKENNLRTKKRGTISLAPDTSSCSNISIKLHGDMAHTRMIRKKNLSKVETRYLENLKEVNNHSCVRHVVLT